MSTRTSRVLHRSLRETPPKAIGGEGVYLFAEDGRRVIDASGGAAVSCLGHQHPRVIAAMAKQAEALAETLVGHEPGGLAYAYFVSGRSEAIEASIKLARQYFIERGEPQRQHFIARRQSYHGNTLGALAAGGNAWRRAPYAPLLSAAFSHVTPAFAYHEKHEGESDARFVARLAAELEAEFQRLRPNSRRLQRVSAAATSRSARCLRAARSSTPSAPARAHSSTATLISHIPSPAPPRSPC